MPLLIWHEQKPLHSQHPQRPGSMHILQNYYMASKSPYHHLPFTQQLSHLCNGVWHLYFLNLVLLLMHLQSDSHSKVNVMSVELIRLRVFAKCI